MLEETLEDYLECSNREFSEVSLVMTLKDHLVLKLYFKLSLCIVKVLYIVRII